MSALERTQISDPVERTLDVQIRLLRSGIKRQDLANRIGIDRSNLYRWMRDGLREDRYVLILEAMEDLKGGGARG